MTECWAEGDLRAYLDGELPAAERELAAAHLQVCAECSGRYAELAERAARVGNLMAALTEPARVATGEHKLEHKLQHVPTAAALALAAALAIGLVMLPKREAPGAGPVANAPTAVPPAPAAEPARVAVAPAAARRPSRRQTGRPLLRADYYLSLDGEPIETGTVMRVGVENGDLQAELILGPDGRAHAIRMVSDK